MSMSGRVLHTCELCGKTFRRSRHFQAVDMRPANLCNRQTTCEIDTPAGVLEHLAGLVFQKRGRVRTVRAPR